MKTSAPSVPSPGRLRVQFDGQIFFRQSVGGVSRYFVCLARELRCLGQIDATIDAPVHVNLYLRDEPALQMSGKYVNKLPRSARLLTIANVVWLSVRKRRESPDLVHQTYYNKNGIFFPRCPIVTTVHDLIHERSPREFSWADNVLEHKRYAISRADHIICVSRFTKDQLVEVYGVKDAAVSVIYLASSVGENSPVSAENPIGCPYLLYVGRRQGYKNWGSVLAALGTEGGVWKDFKLVCFGGGPPTRAELREAADLKVPRNGLVFTSGSDAFLADLYRFATALIFPSRYEGFGLPVLEAMSLGCPVICSNATSIPEVGGRAAAYFDPNDLENMRHVILKTLYSSTVLETLRGDGLVRAQRFSWRECALQTATVYRDLVGLPAG